MLQARANAACALTQDGRVLVAGGSNLQSAEVYDPSENTWTGVGNMSVARTGGFAVPTSGGAILLVGGEPTGAVELFLTNDRFMPAGTLSSPRADYAVLSIHNGDRIAIVGGTLYGDAVPTVDLFEVYGDVVKPAANLRTARRNFAAAALYDGRIFVAGGYDQRGTPLATTEIYDPVKGTSTPGPTMRSARVGHEAHLLPNNGRVMLVGGTDGTNVLGTSEVFSPFDGGFETPATLHNARTAMAATLLRRGGIVVAGGKNGTTNLKDSEVYSFATVESDKDDYHPGESAHLTARGFKPGETVQLTVAAFPLDQHQTEFTASAQADGNGNAAFANFNIDQSHLGARFLATATGSDYAAQTYFTDLTPTTITLNLSNTQGNFNTGPALDAFGLVSPSAGAAVNNGTVSVGANGAYPYTVNVVNHVLLSDPPSGTWDFTFPTNAILPGTNTINAKYNGDGGVTWAASGVANASYTVFEATSTSIGVLPGPTNDFGSTVTLTSTVTGVDAGAGNPTTGTVTFIDTNHGNVTIGGPVVLSGGNTASLPTNGLSVGIHQITATYAPANPGFATSTGGPLGVTIVPQATPGFSLTFSPISPAPVGTPVFIQFSVAPVNGVIPTGSVVFSNDGSPISGNIQLVNGTASTTYSLFTQGTHNVAVAYSGDSNYSGLAPATTQTPYTIAKATPTAAVTTTPQTPIVYGTRVTLNGTVTGPNGAPAPGGLGNNFQDGGGNIPGATGLTVISGQVSASNILFTAGTHPLTLVYAGDTNYNPITSPAYSLSVSKAVPGLILTSTTTAITIGQSITYTVVATAPNSGAGTPPNAMTFQDGATNIPGCIGVTAASTTATSATFNCTVTYDGSGGVHNLGGHAIAAVYAPVDTNWDTTTSNQISFTIAKGNPTVSSALSTNPLTTQPAPATFNAAGSAIVTFSPSGPPALTGSVNFFDNNVLIGTQPVVSGGAGNVYTLPVSVTQSAGTHTLTATYVGDSNYNPVNAGPVNYYVGKATPTLGSFTFNPGSTVTYGASVTLGVTVTGVGGVFPTGTVTVTSGANTLGTGTLNGAGIASITFNETALSATGGPYTLTYTYNGDANYTTANTPTQTLTVNKATPGGSLNSNPSSPVNFSAPLTLTATFTVPGAGSLTGTADFFDGATQINAGPVNLSGNQATFSVTTPLAPGPHTLTARYNGDNNFNTFTTAGFPLTVNAAPTTVTVTPSTFHTTINNSVIYTVNVTGGPANATGTITLTDNGNSFACSPSGNLTAGNAGTITCTVNYDGSANHGGGNHVVQAVYTSNNAANWGNATSASVQVQIDKANVTISAVTSSAGNSFNYGTGTTFSATVTPNSPTPAYTAGVQFVDNGGTVLATVPAASFVAGTATTASLTLGAGTHSITAQYVGDADYNASPLSAALVVTIAKANPTVAVPSSPFTQTFGSSFPSGTVTVTGAGGGAATPTGNVTVSSSSTPAPIAGSGTLNNAGTTSFNIGIPPALQVGNNQNLTFNYGGDTNYNSATFAAVINVTKATAGVLVTVSNPTVGTPVYGQPVTLTATFTGVTGDTVTGTVNFAEAGVLCGTVAINGGAATCTVPNAGPTAPFAVGNHTVTVNTFSSANYNLTASPTNASFAVVKANTTTVLTSSANPQSPGQNITYTATVAVNAPGAATIVPNGVQFQADGTNISGCAAQATALVAGVATATCTTSFATANPSSHIITATYLGDGNTNTSSVQIVQNITKPVPQITVLLTPSGVLPGNSNPSVYGQTVGFTATLTVPANSPAPNGTVQFYDGANTLGGLQALTPVSATVFTASVVVPSGSIALLTGGNHSISATYIPGNNDNYGQQGSQLQNPPSILSQQVNRANSKTVNFQVTANPSSIVFGEAVTFSVDVAPNDAGNTGVPTGFVQFSDAGNPLGNPVPLIAVGGVQRATLSNFTGLAVGAHTQITATYQGDQNFATSTSANTAVPVAKDPTKVTLGAFPASPTYGASITLTAQVCGLAPGSTTNCSNTLPSGPTGTISFYDGGTGGTLLGTSGPIDNTGTASITIIMQNPPFPNPVIGNHPQIVAHYNGDANFLAGDSSQQQLSIGKGNTTSSVVSSANPSVTGQAVTFTATINAPASQAAPPSGTVTFQDGGVTLGSSTIVVNGGISQATLVVPSGSISALTVGQHVISVNYSGDASYNPSNSPLSGASALTQTVNKAATTTSISSSANQSNVGQQVTLTAVVAVVAPGSGVPTGSVQFINTSSQPLATVLGTSPLTVSPAPGGGSGNVYTAAISLSNLPQGNPTIIARYSGDNGYLGSDSAPLNQAVNKSPTNIVLTTSQSPSILGNQVTFAVTVTPVPPGTGTPTGQITIFDGTTSLGNFTLQGGQYNFTTSSLGVGNHAIGVAYLGDVNFQPFNSPTILQVVNRIPTSLNLTSNAPTAIASQIITFTAVLSPNPVPGVPFASGQVGFYDGAALMGVANLQSNVATLNVSNLIPGNHQISAKYVGDINWQDAVSGFYAQTVTPASTQTQIVSSANPSVWGQPVTLTVTVTVPFPGTVPATGQVVIQEKGNNITDPITADNGTFQVTLKDLSVGTHNLTATFLATASFATSSSATLPQVVNKAATATTLAVLPNNSTSKQSVTMTAVVNIVSPGLGTPTGQVEFVDTTFNKSLGKADLKVLGGIFTATLTTDQLNQSGSPQILTATYSGDANFASSTSDPKGQSVFGTQIVAVNGASYTSSNMAADSWVTIYGDNLANTQLVASTTPYPTALAGTTVQVTDSTGTQRLAPIYFVSPGQINMLMPTNTAFGLATVTVTNPNGASASSIILVTRTAPGLFSANATGAGVAAALVQRVRQDGSQAIENVATFDGNTNQMVAVPITIGSDNLYLQLYGTGIRYVAGLNKVTCTIGGQNATVLYAGAAPGFPGLDQVNVQIPAALAGAGSVNVVVTVDGQASNPVTLTFK
jgi:hypothetical protein